MKKIYCRNCKVHMMTLYYYELSEDDDFDYCSVYCQAIFEYIDISKYMKKPKWVK